MLTDVGEYFVGAYLRLIEQCDFVDYNVRAPGGGLAGLGELDVVGFNFRTKTAFLCEVTTHIRGLLISNQGKDDTVPRIKAKHGRQKEYAARYLKHLKVHRFQFWSPVVPRGRVAQLAQIEGLELVINGEYARRVDKLMMLARVEKYDTRNPVFRMMQILGSLRRAPSARPEE